MIEEGRKAKEQERKQHRKNGRRNEVKERRKRKGKRQRIDNSCPCRKLKKHFSVPLHTNHIPYFPFQEGALYLRRPDGYISFQNDESNFQFSAVSYPLAHAVHCV
jgi:hypothetical protein